MALVRRKAPEKTERLDCPLSIMYRNVTDLRLDPANPRLHSPRQIRQIARSIEAFGFNVPILVDAKGQVIAGHGRVRAAQLLGMTQVPTIRLEHLTDPQIRAFMIADNRLTENSSWDERLLAQQIKSLSEVELDFSLEVIGFEIAEIDTMIDGLEPPNYGLDDPADVILDSPTKHDVTRTGDLWILDRHRVYCGDALDATSYFLLMKGHRAGMVFTDPPYNVPIAGHATGLGKIQHRDFRMASGEMTSDQFRDFLTQALGHLAEHSTDGALHFVCMDWRHLRELLAAGDHVYSELKNLCVWVKDNGGMGSLYRSQHELIFVFKNGRAPHRNNVDLGQYGRYRTNVWQYPGVNSFSRKTDEGNLLELHPTVKPVALVVDAVLDCTARNDIVLDPFLGSGTTIIATERSGRVSYGIELDPLYVDTAIRRWQAFTGKNAVNEALGKTFGELEREAQND